MSITLFNTMGRSMQTFVPLADGKVAVYGCGPTVYNYAHIGNMRPYVFQDVLKKTFRFLGYEVTHVMNITDIGHLSGDSDDGEDKMVKSAQERGQTVLEIAEYYTKAFFKDVQALNIEKPEIVCKATDHIQDMIELNKKLEENGHTYFRGGNLYFDISTFPNYGKLANLRLEDLKAGARIDIDSNKKNPQDFVLWFTKSKFENQALTWDSPWGRGYPGWHVECSAMSMKYLGDQFDIHTGGVDHIQIHHTNEIAQSEGATGKKWVNYWLHNEFLVLDKGKMSKSDGSFLTLQNLIDKGYEALDYRYFLLGAHYRSQLTFSWESMDSAKNARKNLLNQIAKIIDKTTDKNQQYIVHTANQAKTVLKESPALPYINRFKTHLEKDINTARALSELQGLVRDKQIPLEDKKQTIHIMDSVLGLQLLKSAQKLHAGTKKTQEANPRIESLIHERTEAKRTKDFEKADKIRNLLKAEGIILEDTATGTRWKRSKPKPTTNKNN